MTRNSDGNAILAPWLIKVLTAAAVAALVSFVGAIAASDHDQDIRIVAQEEKTAAATARVDNIDKKLDRIEGKLDRLIEEEHR